MATGNYYSQDAERYLEIVCGVGIAVFAALAGVGAAFMVARSYLELGALAVAAVLALMSWALCRLAFKLFRGQSRLGEPLFSSWVIFGGAILFLFGGVLLLVPGAAERDIRPILGGIGSLPASYFAWKLAVERRRSRALPDISLERPRER